MTHTHQGKSFVRNHRMFPASLRYLPNLILICSTAAHVETRAAELLAWTEHADSGVGHFSGEAICTKQIEVPCGIKRAVLDLGDVFDIAEVVVDGKSAGISWTKPFEVDISDLLVPGENKMEIRMANRWINPLIGDEQLVPGAKYSGPETPLSTRGVLQEFPAWWDESQPPRERISFATWKHYDGSEELVPSALLGPVMLRLMR